MSTTDSIVQADPDVRGRRFVVATDCPDLRLKAGERWRVVDVVWINVEQSYRVTIRGDHRLINVWAEKITLPETEFAGTGPNGPAPFVAIFE